MLLIKVKSTLGENFDLKLIKSAYHKFYISEMEVKG